MAGLRRLSLIATSAWRIPHGEVPENGSLLSRVLNPALPGRAWLQAGTSATSESPSYEQDAAGVTLGRRVNDRIARFLSGQADNLDALPHRVFMDADRLAALTGTDVDANIPYAAIDFRVGRVGNDVSWRVSIALESGPPENMWLRPPEIAGSEEHRRVMGPYAQRRDALALRARLLERVLAEFFTHAEFRVLDRTYLQPDFYVCIPEQTVDDPAQYCRGTHQPVINDVASSMLKVADMRDDVVATVVLNGRYLVSRRVSRASEAPRLEYAPLYVIIPAAVADPAACERDIRQLIAAFADIEVRSGSLIDDLRRDLYVWNNHLEVYYTTAARGARLWDALATHMPVRRWRKLSRVHAAMELMHQMLLQGTADLAHLASRAHSCPAKVHATSAELGDLYDDTFTERQIPGYSGGIRAAITETGLIGRIARSSQEITTLATLVQQNYEDLLDAITKAFDERRVREGDSLQRSSVLLSVSLGLVGVVTVADATIDLRKVKWSWLASTAAPQWGAGVSLAIGTVLLTSALVMVGRLLQVGRLGSRKFRKLYDGGVWDFLRASCTESLEEFNTHASPSQWSALDTQLAKRFAALWDQATQTVNVHQRNADSRNIDVLTRLIEQWCLHGLLATERARRMYRYHLPQLTTMYRCASRLPGSFLELRYLTPGPHPVNIVSKQEYARTLANSLGINPSDAYDIDAWLAKQSPETCAQALRLVDSLSLKISTGNHHNAGGISQTRTEHSLDEPGTNSMPATTIAR